MSVATAAPQPASTTSAGQPTYEPWFQSADGIGGFDLDNPLDQAFAFDYTSSGKLDHLVLFRPGSGMVMILELDGDETYTPVFESAAGIGGYDLASTADRAFAFDYDSSGKLDHLVFYRPGTGAIFILKNAGGTFTAVYAQGAPGSGIGGYDLAVSTDRAFAFDYDSSGKLDHLVLYRPGRGAVFILKNVAGTFTAVYAQGAPGSGIGGYDLASTADRAFALDYDSSGKLDHLVLYRPGTGAVFILKNAGGTYTPVYAQGDPGSGIGGYDLASAADRAFALDYDSSGKLDHLVLYRPGTGAIFILKHAGATFTAVYAQGDPGSGIGGYDLASSADRVFGFDVASTGSDGDLALYRPGSGRFCILETVPSGASAGPGPIARPAVFGGPGFSLGTPAWTALQVYVTDGLSLPTTADEFRASLGPGAPSDLSDFTQLIAAYASVSHHCATWASTYDAIGGLATSVVQYGTQHVPAYYLALLNEANVLVMDPTDARAQAALKSMLATLTSAASGYAAQAATVARQVQTFETATRADKTALVGTDGTGGLTAYYAQRYASANQDVVAVTASITAQSIVLQAANAEYDHDVAVAASTPAYAWVWPFGTIAAGVVAGVYGQRARDALDAMHAAQATIAGLQAQYQADANLMAAILLAQRGMLKIDGALPSGLPAIQLLEGTWSALAADLGAIAVLIDTDISQVPPLIMNLGIQEAITAWANAAAEARAFTDTMDVHQTGGAGAQMLAWKVAAHVASPAALALAA